MRRNAYFSPYICLLLFFMGCAASAEARRADSLADSQIREVVERTVKSIPSGAKLDMERREDLEEIVSTLEENQSSQHVYFYEMHSPPQTASEASSVWVVAVAHPAEGVYKLYSFDDFAGPDAPSLEFNRFTSDLALSISEKNAITLARLFLAACLEGDAEEMVLNDATELRLAVQDYYFAAYGDLWKALDQDSRWWQGFEPNADAVAPTMRRDGDGHYGVVIERLLIPAGKHPQVQQWHLEVSREGTIGVRSMQLVFPEGPSWLFYDQPAALRNPSFGAVPQ
jgi:hypothetical protein